MELRRLSIVIALFVVAYVSQCSEARHAIERRQTDDVSYEDNDILADEASDDEAQNDADTGNDADDEDIVIASIVSKPRNYNTTVGDTVRLECAVTPDDGAVVVQWTKDGAMYSFGTKKQQEVDLSAYTKDPRFVIAANSTDLVIRDVRPIDGGVYRCEILQADHPAIEHNLTIFESPEIVRFTASDNGNLVEGADLFLICDVKGTPVPQILWSRDNDQGNKRLRETDGEITTNSVFIRNVSKQHSGKYYCYAFNSVGNTQAEVRVNVMGKPRVHVHKHVINSAVNVQAVLECSVKDHHASYIRWYKDGVRIEDTSRQYSVSTQGQNSTLTVTPTADQDFGTFTCEAENNLGKHNRSIELVQSPVVEELKADGPKLSWRVHSHQPLEQMEIQLRELTRDGEWKAIDVPLPATQNHQYEVIFNLLEKQLDSGKYEASVKVRNNKSWSAQNDTIRVDLAQNQPQLIQASVYRDAGSNAFSTRPATSVMTATTIMYLLVRML